MNGINRTKFSNFQTIIQSNATLNRPPLSHNVIGIGIIIRITLKKRTFLNPGRFLTLIHESWKKIENAGPYRARFAEKIPSTALHHLYMFLCFGIFFRKSRSVMVPENDIYFCSARHLCTHIGICHLKLA